jgi:ubiquinone/menaquinone biosynthesis C-methylase UbiE
MHQHRHQDVGRFDEWGPSYEQHWMQRRIMGPVQQMVVDMAAEAVPSPRSILDIGCGTGRLLRQAATRFPQAQLDGVDPAEGMIKQGIALLPPGASIRLRQGTAEALPFSDGEFDLVLSTMSFHHWQDRAQGVREVRRVLAPGGRWLLADVVPAGPFVLLSHLIHIGGIRYRSNLDAMVAAAGLAILAERKVPRMGGNIPVLVIGLRGEVERAMGIEPT